MVADLLLRFLNDLGDIGDNRICHQGYAVCIAEETAEIVETEYFEILMKNQYQSLYEVMIYPRTYCSPTYRRKIHQCHWTQEEDSY